MTDRLPFQIREAIVKALGKAFHYKDPFRAFLLSCGVPHTTYDRYGDEPKFKIARHILADLDGTPEGYPVLQSLVTELCKFRKLPDEEVPDRDGAFKALRRLKELAISQKIVVEEQESAAEVRAQEAKRKQAAHVARAAKMERLLHSYNAMVSASKDPQARGYGLEDLLGELFGAYEMAYRPPYRTSVEQIDGHFSYKGFDYLVEARWREGPPPQGELAAFKAKVDKKLQSTRGVFISIVGFRQEVVLEFTRGASSNIILLDGQDLALILEGHVSLVDGLDRKIHKAAQEGIIYYPLSQRFGDNGG